jgi:glycosyltransferase involved in cell wall biosynthesis
MLLAKYKSIVIASALIITILLLPSIITKLMPHAVALPSPESKKPLMVLCMRAYVPSMTAGAEITSHVTNKYLQAAGWDVVVIVKHWVTPSYEGIPIIQSKSKEKAVYDDDPIAASYLARASCIGFQNIGFEDALDIAKTYKKPAIFFIHATSAGKEFFNYTGGWPIGIVYNSWTMMGDISAPYKSYIVKPWVDINKFQINPSNPTYVTLINLNESKGGKLLIDLAKRMPTTRFLGVKGGYGEQIIDNSQMNITYHEKTDRIEDIYNQTKILIVPSQLETWGRVAVEAMAAGIPIIINDVPGLRECTKDAAIICRREDPDAWVDQIKKLTTIPSYYAEWSARSRARAKELQDDSDMRGLGPWLSGFIGGAQ